MKMDAAWGNLTLGLFELFFLRFCEAFAEICGDSGLCLKAIHKFRGDLQRCTGSGEELGNFGNPENTHKMAFRFVKRLADRQGNER